MPFLKQKSVPCITTIRYGILLLLMVPLFVIPSGCRLVGSVANRDRQAKVNKRIDTKHQKSYQEARAEFRKRHYERQAEKTRKRMDYNAKMAEEWRKKKLHYNEPSVFEKIFRWFEKLYAYFDRPEKGLFNY